MLLLVHGEEPFFARRRLRELKEEAEAKGFLVQDIDCKEDKVVEVFQGLNTSSLFSQKKLLLFRDPFAVRAWEDRDVQKAILKAAASHDLVFFVPEQAKKSEPLFKLLERKGSIEEFRKLAGAKLRNWVAQAIKQEGVPFEPGAEDLLLSACGQDLPRLAQEIRKLASFKRFPQGSSVTKQDVLSLTSPQLQTRIFSTIDALGARDGKKATKLLAGHLKAGEQPLQLLSMFAWQFRQLLSIKDLEERGVSRQEIARKLKLHPFLAQKSFAASSRFSLEELKALYARIFSLDLSFKTGRGNEEQLLFLFFGQAAAKEKR